MIRDMKPAVFVAAALCALCGAAFAATPSELADANRALDNAYKQVLSQQHTQKDRDALRNLERAWIAYKDKECAFEVGGGDGTAQRPSDPGWSNWSDCELRTTKARTAELNGLVCVGVSACNPH